MDLYLLRHGPAEERGPAWPDDGERPLSADGKKKTREAARGMRRLEVRPEAILTSPLVRARQTAEIVAQELGLADRLRETGHLEPGAGPEALFRAIREHAPSAGSVMVVGHEPDLGFLVSRLLAGTGRAIDAPMKKGGLARVEVDSMPPARGGTLKWFLAPGILRAVGAAGAS